MLYTVGSCMRVCVCVCVNSHAQHCPHVCRVHANGSQIVVAKVGSGLGSLVRLAHASPPGPPLSHGPGP